MQTIHITNTNADVQAQEGLTLSQLAAENGIEKVIDPKTGRGYEVLAAIVDHKLKELSYRIGTAGEVEFIGYNHPDGRRTYIRSLCFVLQRAVRELYPDKVLSIDHSLPGGLYCELKEPSTDSGVPQPQFFLTDAEIGKLKQRMAEIIAQDLPFERKKVRVDEAEKIFASQHQSEKVALFHSLGHFFCTMYYLGGDADTFHGPLVSSTGVLKTFDLAGFNAGFCLQLPSSIDPDHVGAMRRQSKIAASLKEYSDWCDVLGASGIGALNEAVLHGNAVRIINLAEALQERKYAAIADDIYSKRDRVKIIFIAGPSSSGKTSSSLRLALQCKVLGMNPQVIELDNYFVNREDTPKDENGEYDFEALEAMDLRLLNEQLNDLIAGKEVEIPKFNFKKGHRDGVLKTMRLGPKDILVMEGIHALNPAMVADVDQSKVYRVYVSALTSLGVDENNNISTSDNRQLRRMVRDNRVRGISPEDTILRWQSVRRGEERNIFPYQENSDAIFNSALLYELPMLKYYAEPLLRRIMPTSPAYSEAIRLLKFLGYIVALSPDEIAAIPPTSIMREFIGGQSL